MCAYTGEIAKSARNLKMSTVSDENFLELITRHISWDRYIEEIDLIETFTAEERQRAQAAVYTLKALLGDDDWLRDAVRKRHPIFSDLANNAVWSRRMLIRMVEAIETLRNCSNFVTVTERLQKADKYVEAASVLELAYKFHLAGFEITFDPSIKITRKDGSSADKVPDFKVTDTETGEDIFVEVSALGYNDTQIKNSRTYDILLRVVMGLRSTHRVMAHVQFFHALDDDLLQVAIEVIKKVMESAQTSGTFQSAIIPGLIEVGAAPQDQIDVAEDWAIGRGIEPTQPVQGPEIDLTKELKRLVMDKIGKEAKQLPKDRPGIIIITMDRTLLFFAWPLENILKGLVDRMKKAYAQLVCVAVTRRHYGDGKQEAVKLTSSADYSIIEKVMVEPLQETTIVVPHKACLHSSAPSIVAKVQQAFSGLKE